MRIEVRFFAQLRERIGAERAVDVKAGTTVAAVWAGIAATDPKLAKITVRFAVNEEYVKPTYKLQDGDELAIFPPVSGGCTV